jgi:hypothetical protein
MRVILSCSTCLNELRENDLKISCACEPEKGEALSPRIDGIILTITKVKEDARTCPAKRLDGDGRPRGRSCGRELSCPLTHIVWGEPKKPG